MEYFWMLYLPREFHKVKDFKNDKKLYAKILVHLANNKKIDSSRR